MKLSLKHGALMAVCLLLIAADPYSWGRFGTAIGPLVPNGAPDTAWQPPVAITLGALLVLGVLVLLRKRRAGLVILLVECAGYVAVNITFAVRDGSGRFADAGYENAAVGILPFVGLAARVLVLRGIFRPTVAENRVR